ncbi:hypothetical protein DL767_007729 [Monosporascus sp. MG133]|nr:hypothetical protein DL767_007729 [Monosporascus sp. MG133]
MPRDFSPDITPALLRLPDELLEAIASNLSASDLVAFGKTCKRAHKITCESSIWKQHCISTWRYWEERHDLPGKLDLPPGQTDWHKLYSERAQIDREALDVFNQMLLTQRRRYERMQQIAAHRYDVKDLMLSLKNETPDSAEDVLARRYHANAILGQVHRATAVEKWMSLQQGQPVKLEEALGAYDLFVLAGDKGDLGDIKNELDRIARLIKEEYRNENRDADEDAEFDHLTVRQKATRIALYLRSANLVGNPSAEDYHALRNNFISLALFDDRHTSLPLQSVAIYCAVAERLGVTASPSNFPQHVHAVIQSPPAQSLDGAPAPSSTEFMYMDPWNSGVEVPQDQLQQRLVQMGVPPGQHAHYLGAATTLEMVLRTGRNIMTSVEEARHRLRQAYSPGGPDVEAAWYSMLWSMLILGDSNPLAARQRRRQCLGYLVEHFHAHFPEDIGLIELTPPLFEGEYKQQALQDLVDSARAADRDGKKPSPRDGDADAVRFRVGAHFRHRRYGYEGFIVGWDTRCSAGPRWIEQMRVDQLPRGAEQPFYNVVADDNSHRYVAEENIEIPHENPSQALMELAGRYFKRWDEDSKTFVSNIRDEYPDD